MPKKEIKVSDKYIKWFSELDKRSVKIAGGKGANLGEMYNLGLPVPPGFVIVANAYKYFLEKTGLEKEIYTLLSTLDIENTKDLDDASKKIKDMIKKATMPEDMGEEIRDSYDILGSDEESLQNASADVLTILKNSHSEVFVAVRSSATAEDTEAASFAGQNETFLNVKGKDDVIEAVKGCIASLFTARSIYYRIKKGFKHEDVLLAVVVQQMVNSDKSGVIFSRDPMSTKDTIIVESVFGLGEGIVSGMIKPDHYEVSRDLKINLKQQAEKKIALCRNSAGHTEIVKLTDERSKSQVLTEYEIKRLGDYAMRLEEHYGKPQDIEFAVDSGHIFIVQTRPITTKAVERTQEKIEGKLILEGNPASPGVGSGEVKVIVSMNDLEKIRKGDVMVTIMTNPDMVVAMQKASGIVTDEGGATSHAAIVSREMGIPAIVGTGKATKLLKDGMIVTVDGFEGKVYEGALENLKHKEIEILEIVPTQTKIKTIVDLPDYALRAAKTKCSAVGLTRMEGIIAESGKHPLYFVKRKEMDKYEDLIYEGIKKIAEPFEEVWVRTSDIRSDEFRHIEGAPSQVEMNPMLGMHGVRFSLKHKEILKAEIKAAKRVAENKIIGIMCPQVISVEEVREVKEIMKEIGLHENMKIGVMIETPAAVQIIGRLCKEGIDFISFGTNDLTQFTLAIDRNNEEVQYLYDEMHPAVLKQISYVIGICRSYGVETSICGQAASKKEMVEYLVKHGIDSLSANADKAGEISIFVKDLEEKGLKGSLAKNYDHAAKNNKSGVSEDNKNSQNRPRFEDVEEKIEDAVDQLNKINEKEKSEENAQFYTEIVKEEGQEFVDVKDKNKLDIF